MPHAQFTVNHQGGKTSQSHPLQAAALCYYIYSAFDSALCGAVKTNATVTTSFGVCALPLGVDRNIQATLRTISKILFLNQNYT